LASPREAVAAGGAAKVCVVNTLPPQAAIEEMANNKNGKHTKEVSAEVRQLRSELKDAKASARSAKKAALAQTVSVVRSAAAQNVVRPDMDANYLAALVDPQELGRGVGVPDGYHLPTYKHQMKQYLSFQSANFTASGRLTIHFDPFASTWNVFTSLPALPASQRFRIGNWVKNGTGLTMLDDFGNHPSWITRVKGNTGSYLGTEPIILSFPSFAPELGINFDSASPIYGVGATNCNGSYGFRIMGGTDEFSLTVNGNFTDAQQPNLRASFGYVASPGDDPTWSSYVAPATLAVSGVASWTFTVGSTASTIPGGSYVIGMKFYCQISGNSDIPITGASVALSNYGPAWTAEQIGQGNLVFARGMPQTASVERYGTQRRLVSASLLFTNTSAELSKNGRITALFNSSQTDPWGPVPAVDLDSIQACAGSFDGPAADGTYGFWTPSSVEDMAFPRNEPLNFQSGFLSVGVVIDPSITGQSFRAVFVCNYETLTMDITLTKTVSPYNPKLVEIALAMLSPAQHFCSNESHLKRIQRFLAKAAGGTVKFVLKNAPAIGGAVGSLVGPEGTAAGAAVGKLLQMLA